MFSIIAHKSTRIVQRRSLSIAVKYNVFGNPFDVLKLDKTEIKQPTLDANGVQLKFLFSPINPSDINMIEGVYGKKPSLPAIGGNEGLAVVTKVGSSVKDFKEGEWVIPMAPMFGTWRQDAIASDATLLKVPNDIPAPYAATLSVNPASSYRLLRDFETLKPGDIIIQNGANSMLGMGVIQMARELGVTTINVVRSDRPAVETTLRLLTNLGGDINFPDTFLETPEFAEMLTKLPPIRLGLNGVGGHVATSMAKALAPNGTLVTYGGRALTLPESLVNGNQLKSKGFWMSEWYSSHSVAEREEMIAAIAQLIRDEKLAYFFELHDLDDFEYALRRATAPHRLRKVLLNLDFPDRMKEHDALTDADYEHFQYPAL